VKNAKLFKRLSFLSIHSEDWRELGETALETFHTLPPDTARPDGYLEILFVPKHMSRPGNSSRVSVRPRNSGDGFTFKYDGVKEWICMI
jgi:hypothetical protein